MAFKKIIAIASTVALTLQLTLGCISPVSAARPSNRPLADTPPIPHTEVSGNLIENGGMNTSASLGNWTPAEGETLEWVTDSEGGHLMYSNIAMVYVGATYTFDEPIPAGKYKFSAYVRTAHEGHISHLRWSFKTAGNDDGVTVSAFVDNNWLKTEFTVEFQSNLAAFALCGGPRDEYIQPYCFDEVSLIRVDDSTVVKTPAAVGSVAVTPELAYASSPEIFGRDVMWDPVKDAQYDVQGIMINHDCVSISYLPTNEEAWVTFAQQFEGTHVTDFALCVGAGIGMDYDSKVATSLSDMYEAVYATGATPDNGYKMFYDHFVVAGLDYYEILCREFKNNGVNCWLALRMNDSHDIQGAPSEDSLVLSEFFRSNPQFRRIQYSGGISEPGLAHYYYRNNMDYTYEEVRDYHLRLINEMLDRYDMYGLLLEWQRDPWVWHIGGEYRGLEIMNDFMRDVEAIVAIYEEKYGHNIKIGVDVPSDLQINYDLGFDIVNWASEGIVDLVIPRSRWASTDTNAPIRLWKSILAPYGVKVAGGIEDIIQGGVNEIRGSNNIETMIGSATNFLSQGADMIYLYNHFPEWSLVFKDYHKIADYSVNEIKSSEGRWLLWTTIGSYEKCLLANRKIILGANDIYPLWEQADQQLPVDINGSTPGAFRMVVGDIANGANVTLSLAAAGASTANAPTVYVNSQRCTFKGITTDPDGRTLANMFVYEVPAAAHHDMYFVVELIPTASDALTIEHAEVFVDVGN